MADKDLPDYMRGLDGDDDWGFVAVPDAPKIAMVEPEFASKLTPRKIRSLRPSPSKKLL